MPSVPEAKPKWTPFLRRLKKAFDEASPPLSVNAFGRAIGKDEGYASKLLRGLRGQRPTGQLQRLAAECLNVRLEWLVDGKAPMREPGARLVELPRRQELHRAEIEAMVDRGELAQELADAALDFVARSEDPPDLHALIVMVQSQQAKRQRRIAQGDAGAARVLGADRFR